MNIITQLKTHIQVPLNAESFTFLQIEGLINWWEIHRKQKAEITFHIVLIVIYVPHKLTSLYILMGEIKKNQFKHHYLTTSKGYFKKDLTQII